MFSYSRWRKYMKSLTPLERKIWWYDKLGLVVSMIITVAIAAMFFAAVSFGIRGIAVLVKRSNAAAEERAQKRYDYVVEHWNEHTPRYIRPFMFEGHKYLEMSGGGICHAESCPCKTNKVEAIDDD